MLPYTRIAIIPVCALAFALGACEEENTIDNDTDNAPMTQDDPNTPDGMDAGAPNDPTVAQELAEFRDRMAREIDDLNIELETIENRADELGEEARERYEAALAELHDRRDNLEERIDQIESGTRARWVQVRAEIEAAFTQLTDNIVEVRREIDGTPN
jgi:chromosome segregation ATPase